MTFVNENKIRHDTLLFLQRKGQGALKELAAAAGLTPESVRKVRQGTRVGLDTLLRCEQALQSLGWYREIDEEASTTAQEATATYHAKPPRDVASIFAGELKLMAEKLESDRLDPIDKGQEFREFIANLHKTAEVKVAAIEKIGKSDN